MATKENTEEFVMVSDGAATEPEIKIVMDTIGDEFIGTYLGMRNISNDGGGYQQARFELNDEKYFMNANWSLKEGLKSVRTGARTRIRFVAEQDTGQASLMRIFTVEVARRTAVRHNPST